MNNAIVEAQRGVALALALIVSFLLFIITFEVAHTTRIEQFITNNIEIDTRLEVACQAGYEVATARLREDRQQTEIDSMQDGWYKLIVDDQLIEADVGEEEFLVDTEENDGDWEEPEDTVLYIKIFDESAKYNVYMLLNDDPKIEKVRRDQLASVIDQYREGYSEDLSLSEGQEIADGVIQFLHRSKERPYRDAPTVPTKKPHTLWSLDELLYVDGIDTGRMYDLVDDDGETIIPGLFRFLTIWSDMQININTAPVATLAGLFEQKDVYLAQRIADTRDEIAEEEEKGLRGPSKLSGAGNQDDGPTEEEVTAGAPFSQINELKEKVDGLTQEIYNQISPFCTVQSNVFSIYVTAERGLVRRTKMYVVRRTERGFRKVFEKLVDYNYFLDREEVENAEDEAADVQDG